MKTWIQFPEMRVRVARHHAVLAEGAGGYWTFCGRFQRYAGVKDVTTAPRAHCACCRGRIERPYLIDEGTAAIAAKFATVMA